MTEFKKGTIIVGYLDGGHWSACFGMSYRDMLLRDLVTNGRIVRKNGAELRALTGTGGIPASRNKIAKDFLDTTDGEWLLFLDTDMGFADDTAERLMESAHWQDRPVMGALCFQLKRQTKDRRPFYAESYIIAPTILEYLEYEDEAGFTPLIDYKRNSVVQCAGTGSACILIHRKVLKKIREKYGDAWYNPITHPTAGGEGNPRTFSEDLSFCIRCQSVEVPIHIDTAIKTTHEKGGVFLDEDTFDFYRRQSVTEDE